MNNAAHPRKVLGRGLESLLNPAGLHDLGSSAAAAPALAHTDDQAVRAVPIAAIQPSPYQPRKSFDSVALEEMAASLRQHGVLQPVLLRPLGAGFQLIAGERRLRAAQLAGMAEIPALVKPLSDERALELTIVENLQREDLNPLDQARAFHQLATAFHLTQDQVAERTGKDRTTIANFLRLLKLEPAVQVMVEEKHLTMGHARALLAVEGEPQMSLARRVAEQGWSVRQLERHLAANSRSAPRAPKPRDPNVRAAEEELARALGTKVSIKDHDNAGAIAIEYYTLADFQRIFERLVGPVAAG